ncbi:MAG TPA: helicase-exonuclease AddAB subunit AddB [Clostridiaceae bacterium]|nr:helicase-exonuclease AddAB subunit AddB [Clostridiaceae bacterium]
MGLRIVYGRAGSGKTHRFLNEIKEQIENGTANKLVLLVPEQFSFQAEKSLISAVGTGGIINTEVLSFQRMAYRIFNKEGGITYPHIHPAGKSMIIYRILDKLRDKFKVFSGSCEQDGFVNTISALITEFKRYNVTPEHLVQVSDELPGGTLLKDKLTELGLIYGEFESTLARRYRDTDDDLALAARKLSESDLYDGADIWIDGFNSFTPQEYKMIGELLKKARSVSVSLCCDLPGNNALSRGKLAVSRETDVFSPIKHTWKKLVSLAEANGTAVSEPVFTGNQPYRFRESPELAHLEKNFFAYPFEVHDGATEAISLFSAMNMFTEIESAAREIVRLCRDEKLRFRDIAVVTRNLPAYEKLAGIIFSEYEIPYHIDRKVDISNHPLVRLILSMMDIFIDNWSYESVFRYLKTGFANIGRSDTDKLENYVLACGIRGSKWLDESPWDMSIDLIPDDRYFDDRRKELDEINRIRDTVVKPLVEFRNKTKGRKNAREFCESLYDFLCELDIPRKMEEWIEKFRQKGELATASEYSQVWNTVMEVLDQAVEVMGDETFGIERFSKILKIGLGEYKIGTIPAALDQVFVGSVERSRSHEIKALFILGANDGIFPSTAMKEGILSDQDRFVLNHLGLELAGDTRMQAFDEQYLVYRTLSVPSRYLRISWPIADDEGRSMRPSIIVSRIKKIFPKVVQKSDIPGTSDRFDMESVSRAYPAFRKTVAAIRQKADGNEIHDAWKEVYRWFSGKDEWKDRCEAIRDAFTYRNVAQKVSEEKVRLLYGDPVYSSVSRLERYTSCPFAFYVQYGLGAKERKIYRLTPPDIGTFIHAVIERFSRMVEKGDVTWRSFDREWCREQVSRIVDEMLEKMQGRGIAASRRFTVLTSRLKRVVARTVWLIAEYIRRSRFDPIDYEVGFGDREKYPPIIIELDSGKQIKLSGRIDRIDALKTQDGTYLSIIDYKSGTKDFRLSDLYYGLQIQLITYMDAIWDSEEKKNGTPVLPGGMLYFRVDDPLIRDRKGLSEEEIEKAIMKKLRMKGLILADVKLIRDMDSTIEGASLTIPATLNKGDVIGKNSSCATLDQFRIMRRYIRSLLKKIGAEIAEGRVDIRPCKKKGITACAYCGFLSICQFDAARRENSYRLLFDKPDDEIWNLLNKETCDE